MRFVNCQLSCFRINCTRRVLAQRPKPVEVFLEYPRTLPTVKMFSSSDKKPAMLPEEARTVYLIQQKRQWITLKSTPGGFKGTESFKHLRSFFLCFLFTCIYLFIACSCCSLATSQRISSSNPFWLNSLLTMPFHFSELLFESDTTSTTDRTVIIQILMFKMLYCTTATVWGVARDNKLSLTPSTSR